MPTTPTSRTLERLRKEGWTCQVVERHKPMPAGKVRDRQGRERMAFFLTTRVDLFGCIDIIAIRGNETLGVQSTSGSAHHAHRMHKIKAEPRMAEWVAGGRRLEIWTWRQVTKYKQSGEKAKRKGWEPRIEAVTIETLT